MQIHCVIIFFHTYTFIHLSMRMIHELLHSKTSTKSIGIDILAIWAMHEESTNMITKD